MKNLFNILILLFSLGFSQNEINIDNLTQYGERYFKENESKPFTGIVFQVSKETGNKILEYHKK